MVEGAAKASETSKERGRPLRPLQAPRPLAEDAADLILEEKKVALCHMAIMHLA